MLNDPASTHLLIEMNERLIADGRPAYSLSAVDIMVETKITPLIAKIHIVNSITRYPGDVFKEKTEEAFLSVDNANKWIDEQVFDETDEASPVYEIVSLDVADYEPPNLLIDSVPEYHAVCKNPLPIPDDLFEHLYGRMPKDGQPGSWGIFSLDKIAEMGRSDDPRIQAKIDLAKTQIFIDQLAYNIVNDLQTNDEAKQALDDFVRQLNEDREGEIENQLPQGVVTRGNEAGQE